MLFFLFLLKSTSFFPEIIYMVTNLKNNLKKIKSKKFTFCYFFGLMKSCKITTFTYIQNSALHLWGKQMLKTSFLTSYHQQKFKSAIAFTNLLFHWWRYLRRNRWKWTSYKWFLSYLIPPPTHNHMHNIHAV